MINTKPFAVLLSVTAFCLAGCDHESKGKSAASSAPSTTSPATTAASGADALAGAATPSGLVSQQSNAAGVASADPTDARSACDYVGASPDFCVAGTSVTCSAEYDGFEVTSAADCNRQTAINDVLEQFCKRDVLLTPSQVSEIACNSDGATPIPVVPVAPVEPIDPVPTALPTATTGPTAGGTIDPCTLSGAAPLFCLPGGSTCSLTLGGDVYTSGKECNSTLATDSIWRQLCLKHVLLTPAEQAAVVCQ